MQLGMIGLGRMGANMVRRLIRGGHQCVVFDNNPASVQELVKEGATGATSLDDFLAKLQKPRAVWLMVPAAVVDRACLPDLTPRLQKGDILIDGGNSYYIDDIRRAKELAAKRHPLRRRRHQRRRLGSGARLLHDDRRRRTRRSSTSIRSSRRWRPAAARSRARPAGRRRPARPSTAICTAGRPGPATSSRWCTTASSTASWPPTPRG